MCTPTLRLTFTAERKVKRIPIENGQKDILAEEGVALFEGGIGEKMAYLMLRHKRGTRILQSLARQPGRKKRTAAVNQPKQKQKAYQAQPAFPISRQPHALSIVAPTILAKGLRPIDA